MAQVIVFPPLDKADFYIKQNDSASYITGYLRDARGPVDMSGATVKFAMRSETQPTSKFKSTATIITDPIFTVDAPTDVITAASHALVDGDLVWVKTSGVLPAGLSARTDYYVISSTTNTFKLSTVKGGTAVNITDAGTGTHTIVAGRAKYTFSASNTDTAGNYYGEFEVTFADTTVATFPNGKYIYISVLADAG